MHSNAAMGDSRVYRQAVVLENHTEEPGNEATLRIIRPSQYSTNTINLSWALSIGYIARWRSISNLFTEGQWPEGNKSHTPTMTCITGFYHTIPGGYVCA